MLCVIARRPCAVAISKTFRILWLRRSPRFARDDKVTILITFALVAIIRFDILSIADDAVIEDDELYHPIGQPAEKKPPSDPFDPSRIHRNRW